MRSLKLKINSLFLVVVVFEASSGSQDVTSSIYGGKPAGYIKVDNGQETLINDGQFPYVVELAELGQHICGGALLKKDVVLTAAHCFKGTSICDVKIWAGSYKKLDRKSDTVQIRDIYDVVIHEMYNMELIGPQPNDIALVFVKEFLLTPFVRPITVSTTIQRDQFTGTLVLMMGYGRIENNIASKQLRFGAVTMLEKRECAASSKPGKFRDTMLCVKCKNTICTISAGDSGSPLVKIDKHGKHILLGIASFSLQYSKSKLFSSAKPAVFTDVAEYKDWTKTVKKSKMPKTNRFLKWCRNH